MQHGVDDVLFVADFTPEAMTLSCESRLSARGQIYIYMTFLTCSFPGIGFNPRLGLSHLLSWSGAEVVPAAANE